MKEKVQLSSQASRAWELSLRQIVKTLSHGVNGPLQAAREYGAGIEGLRNHGALPSMTVYELLLEQDVGTPQGNIAKYLDQAERDGSLAALELLPGPWKYAQTRDEKIALLRREQMANQEGIHTQLYAEYQCQYGDKGLGSNIAVPVVVVHSRANTSKHGSIPITKGSGDVMQVACRVILADARDAERIARIHVRKEPFFGGFMDSIISTTDNEHWQAQRRHLSEAFLPLSSLAEILPVSRARAKTCSDRLARLSAEDACVDMSDFLLHEAQAQLQLALLGVPESVMNSTNADLRKTFMGHPEAQAGKLSDAMKTLMRLAQDGESFGLPTDENAVRGPLSRALQTGGFATATDYGNMLLILFAGHDTTGHTMTWLLFELARHPEIQRKVQAEIDTFFDGLAKHDPEYRDLSHLEFLDCCITETLRLWPAVANGTFRELQFAENVKGPGSSNVTLPKGTLVQIVNWSRHRDPELWGSDADIFNPERDFTHDELAHVGSPMAATNPQSKRFSPFAHNPRSCLGKNFAQMEMRLILAYLLHRFDFGLAPPYDALKDIRSSANSMEPNAFRGVNRGGTMGPVDLERGGIVTPNERYLIAMKLKVTRRSQ